MEGHCRHAAVAGDQERVGLDAVPLQVFAVEGFGEHQDRVAGCQRGRALLVVGFGATGVVEAGREGIAGVAQGIDGRTVGQRGGHAKGLLDAGLGHQIADLGDGGGEGRFGSQLLQAADQEIKEEFAVGCALDPGVKRRIDQAGQGVAYGEVAADLPIVHEKPLAEAKGMAVAARDRRPGGGADMGEEVLRFDLVREAEEVRGRSRVRGRLLLFSK